MKALMRDCASSCHAMPKSATPCRAGFRVQDCLVKRGLLFCLLLVVDSATEARRHAQLPRHARVRHPQAMCSGF